jgi:hypothetical protein
MSLKVLREMAYVASLTGVAFCIALVALTPQVLQEAPAAHIVGGLGANGCTGRALPCLGPPTCGNRGGCKVADNALNCLEKPQTPCVGDCRGPDFHCAGV